MTFSSSIKRFYFFQVYIQDYQTLWAWHKQISYWESMESYFDPTDMPGFQWFLLILHHFVLQRISLVGD